MPIMEFQYVQVKDIATDYAGDKFEVFDKGTLKELFKKYPHQSWGMGDLEQLGIAGSEPGIVHKHSPTPLEGFTHTIYVYGGEGAYVEI